MFDISIKRYLKEARAEETLRLNVDESSVSIGTGTANDIQLEGAGISINHAVIQKEENSYWITDLDTSDGSFLNNELITHKARIKDQDEITIGRYNILVKLPVSEENPVELVINESGSDYQEYDQKHIKNVENVTFVSKFKLSGSLFSLAVLSVVGILIMLFFSIYWFNQEDQTAYSPGPLSNAHTQFNKDCSVCHTEAWVTVPDDACKSCHEVKSHSHIENFTPECVACHIEHHGNTVLAEIQDSECTQCHSELVTFNFIPSKKFHRNINGFENGHPEFSVTVVRLEENNSSKRIRLDDSKNLIDNTAIKFNHSVHMEEGLLGSEGPENLNCESCHRVDITGEYTEKILYERNCSRCHTLEFDIRFGNLTVPHSSTSEVTEFLSNTYSNYALDKSISNPRDWANTKVTETSRSIFEGKCAECHIVEKSIDVRTTEIIEPEIPIRWLPYGKFDHELHVKNLNMKCSVCHNASNSKTTEDVLMPSINTCLECHSEQGGAITDCVLCHEYHENDEPGIIEGTQTIEEILEN